MRAQGFDAVDVSRLSGVITGYALDQIMSARESLQPLELAYFFDTIETEGRIAFRHRGIEPPPFLLGPDSLAELRPGADLVTLTRAQETDLPASARIAYSSSESDYRRAIAEARRLVGASGRVSLAELAIVMEADQATQIAESWLFETWSARDRAQFVLPPSLLAVEPGDIIALEGPGDQRHYRVTEIGDHGAREIDAIRIVPDVYAPIVAGPRPVAPPPVTPLGPPSAVFLDLPLLLGREPPDAGYFAAMLQPWPGALAIHRAPEPSGFTLRALATQPATMGTSLDDLHAGPVSRLDKATTLRVQLDYGTLSSVTDLALLSGANAVAIEHAPGRWEIIQFQHATLVAPSTYELSTLLRGQQGTEWTMSATLPAGARFVLLDAALTRLDLTLDEINLPFHWRYGPSNRDIGSPSYETTVHAFTSLGRRPYAPVRVRAHRDSGDLHITWIRRSRVGGDTWENAEIPLGEDVESYELDVLDGETVVRTLTASATSATYTAAEQAADFGSPPTEITVRVTQLSATYGRGSPAVAVV